MTRTPPTAASGGAATCPDSTSSAALPALLGRAALLRSESPEAYDALAARCAAALAPSDTIEELMVRDYADLTWEIARLRRMTQHVVAVASPEAAGYVVSELSDEEARAEAGADAARAWSAGGDALDQLRHDLAERDVGDAAIETHAFLRELDTIDCIERLVADKERMRRAVLRDLETYRAGALGTGERSGRGSAGSAASASAPAAGEG